MLIKSYSNLFLATQYKHTNASKCFSVGVFEPEAVCEWVETTRPTSLRKKSKLFLDLFFLCFFASLSPLVLFEDPSQSENDQTIASQIKCKE